jgi:hypothetical protein
MIIEDEGLREYARVHTDERSGCAIVMGQREVKRDEVLVSFDVVSLFPSVPIDEAMKYMHQWFHESCFHQSGEMLSRPRLLSI